MSKTSTRQRLTRDVKQWNEMNFSRQRPRTAAKASNGNPISWYHPETYELDDMWAPLIWRCSVKNTWRASRKVCNSYMRCPLRRPTAGEQSGPLCGPVRLSRTLRECCKSSSAYESLHVPRRRLTCEDDEIYFSLVIIFWTGFGGYRPTSDAIVHFERNWPMSDASLFRRFCPISDASLRFRTLSYIFALFRPISNTVGLFWTLTSEFGRFRLILKAFTLFRRLSFDSERFLTISESSVCSRSLSVWH